MAIMPCLAAVVGAKRVIPRVLSLMLLVGFLFVLWKSWFNPSIFEGILGSWQGPSSNKSLSERTDGRRLPSSPFFCPSQSKNLSCEPPSHPNTSHIRSSSCPDYFRWIHEDLRPWKETGITRKMVERAGKTAHFRLLVVKGRLYIESYARAYQTRDTFVWWGVVQLLRRYPGRLPDLDLMFDCDDMPTMKSHFLSWWKGPPPPLFRYCKDDRSFDIPFPDWSFWGWSDLKIKPWVVLNTELKQANEREKWTEREPYAYWKGNPDVSNERVDLLRCNVSRQHDWNARFFQQDWHGEMNQGFQHSNLADQCTYRYKVYIEGRSWSVSQKYIMACDSVTLLVRPKYHDFFSRGLIPLKHYWPINIKTKCRSIKFAVDWGNANKEKAQEIGRNASRFISEEVNIDYVYDYMFHLLNEYAKLLRFMPQVPPNAREVCQDSMLCGAEGIDTVFMNDSVVDVSHISAPCSLPPAFSTEEMESISRIRDETLKLVQTREHRNDLSPNLMH